MIHEDCRCRTLDWKDADAAKSLKLTVKTLLNKALWWFGYCPSPEAGIPPPALSNCEQWIADSKVQSVVSLIVSNSAKKRERPKLIGCLTIEWEMVSDSNYPLTERRGETKRNALSHRRIYDLLIDTTSGTTRGRKQHYE
jgi:hypothetical protein